MKLTPEMIAAAAAIARQGEIAGELIERAVAMARSNGYTVAVWPGEGHVSCRRSNGVSLLLNPAEVFGDMVAEMEAAFASGLIRGFRFS